MPPFPVWNKRELQANQITSVGEERLPAVCASHWHRETGLTLDNDHKEPRAQVIKAILLLHHWNFATFQITHTLTL